MQERLIRVCSEALVGFALAGSGVLLQALLRNPLADPYILGISSGASVGVMGWIVFGGALVHALRDDGAWAQLLLAHGATLPAIGGALAACAVVFALARPRGENAIEPLTLLLAGVVLSAFNGALVMLLNMLVPYGARADIVTYLFGYIREQTSPLTLVIAAACIGIAWGAGFLLGGGLNIAALSDVEATTLGLRFGTLRVTCFVAASVMTAATLAIAGPIGFIGLICPHICRLIFGPDHRLLLVVGPLTGAVFLMLADTFVRSTGAWFQGDLPVGVVTAIVGGPFFLILLRRRALWQ